MKRQHFFRLSFPAVYISSTLRIFYLDDRSISKSIFGVTNTITWWHGILCFRKNSCHLENISRNVRRSQSVSIFSILNHPCSFLVYITSLVFFYIIKLLFWGFLQFEDDFALRINDPKYRVMIALLEGNLLLQHSNRKISDVAGTVSVNHFFRCSGYNKFTILYLMSIAFEHLEDTNSLNEHPAVLV